MNNSSVSFQEVTKFYGKKRAVGPVSFEVQPGELFGLIGPDGAGKTTLFRMLTTLLLPDKGMITLDGLDVVKEYRKVRDRVGYMPGRFSLYQDLTVEENLTFFATIFGTTIQENYHLIRDIYSQIEPFKDRPAGKLSGGMKQKLALSCCLVHKPRVLVLDEPTTGVDAISRKEFWEMLSRLKQEGITMLVSTPYMDEAALCDRVALIQEGNILAIDKPGEIIRKQGGGLYAVRSTKMYQLLQDIRLIRGVEQANLFGQYIHFTLRGRTGSENTIKQQLIDLGHEDLELNPVNPGIEDVFISLMQENHEQ